MFFCSVLLLVFWSNKQETEDRCPAAAAVVVDVTAWGLDVEIWWFWGELLIDELRCLGLWNWRRIVGVFVQQQPRQLWEEESLVVVEEKLIRTRWIWRRSSIRPWESCKSAQHPYPHQPSQLPSSLHRLLFSSSLPFSVLRCLLVFQSLFVFLFCLEILCSCRWCVRHHPLASLSRSEIQQHISLKIDSSADRSRKIWEQRCNVPCWI